MEQAKIDYNENLENPSKTPHFDEEAWQQVTALNEQSLDKETASVRQQIVELGPFNVRQHHNINSGTYHKQYLVLRGRVGSKLGAHPRKEWIEFKKLTPEEQKRTIRYNYDKDQNVFEASLLNTRVLEPLVGFAADHSWIHTWTSNEEGVM